MFKKSTLFILVFLTGTLFSQAQQTQTVRGKIIDDQSKTPLIGASFILLDSDPLLGTVTNTEGEFRLEKVPVGRQNFKISYLGYEDIVLSNQIINSGKEVVLTIEMTEKILTGNEAVVKAKQNKGSTNNDLVSVSGRAFSLDETNRYAGSLGDPSRMVSNFAGVAGGGNDQRNDIVIRGNTPLGLLWRLEGADIPNPNHFSNQGANGGPVSILNNNTLANSDFLTGAWPAEYGAATSGVFDLKMRNGNNEKREHTFQIGFNGVELMTEGPFKKGGASYLFSYRYSTLAFFDALGMSFGDAGVPKYQDLSFKIHLPTKNAGTFSLWGLGGFSSTSIYDSNMDSAERINRFRPQDLEFSSGMMASGLTHSIALGKKAYLKSVVSISGERNRTKVDTLHNYFTNDKSLFFSSASTVLRYSAHSYYNRKVNAKNSFRIGFIATYWTSKMSDSLRNWESMRPSGFRIDNDFDESVQTIQAYANWTHRFSRDLTLNAGLHAHTLIMNSTYSVEPRLGLKYQLNNRNSFSFGYGLHGQAQPLPVYYQKTQLLSGEEVLTNKDLEFTKSHHFVLGYERYFTSNLRMKSEAYYQYLTNVPVTQTPSYYSVVNFGSDFGGLPNIDSLVSNGFGRNYGIEITLERFFNKGFYFLVTGSVFSSEYMSSDGVWRHTAYGSNYVFNALGGKEWKIKSDNMLSINLKATYAGGRRYIPIDLEQSRIENRWVNDETQAYQNRQQDYARVDFRIGFKQNKKRFTQEWALEIQNVFNIQNLLTRQYNPALGQVQSLYQIGIFPVPLYRIQF